jgi:hypothetical protein
VELSKGKSVACVSTIELEGKIALGSGDKMSDQKR